MLKCRKCGAANVDPGGDPRQYRCGVCGQAQLERAPTKPQKVFAAGVAGATLGGLSFGPVGALVGGILALLIGEKEFK